MSGPGSERNSGSGARMYPGPRQILRYLRIEQQNFEDGSVWVRTPVLPDLLDEGGAMRLGAIAPMCDVSAGSLSAAAVSPDWVATLDFKLHLGKPVYSEYLEAVCRPLRVGKNTVVSEIRLSDAVGDAVGLSLVTFSRLPNRGDQPPSRHRRSKRFSYSLDEEESRVPLDEYLGLRFDPDADAFELDHHERIYNSFGSIQGGAMAALLERGASYAAERALGQPARTLDLHYSYTAQARVGPFRVAAEVVRSDAAGVLSRVELIDTGLENRVAAIGTALSVPIA